jgi:hypothetical protein
MAAGKNRINNIININQLKFFIPQLLSKGVSWVSG